MCHMCVSLAWLPKLHYCNFDHILTSAMQGTASWFDTGKAVVQPLAERTGQMSETVSDPEPVDPVLPFWAKCFSSLGQQSACTVRQIFHNAHTVLWGEVTRTAFIIQINTDAPHRQQHLNIGSGVPFRLRPPAQQQFSFFKRQTLGHFYMTAFWMCSIQNQQVTWVRFHLTSQEQTPHWGTISLEAFLSCQKHPWWDSLGHYEPSPGPGLANPRRLHNHNKSSWSQAATFLSLCSPECHVSTKMSKK